MHRGGKIEIIRFHADESCGIGGHPHMHRQIHGGIIRNFYAAR